MPADPYPRFRAATVQAAPVFLDRDATIEKVGKLVEEAASRGADLVVFSESFVPAFPVWNLIHTPIDQHGFTRRLFDNAVKIPNPQFAGLARIARSHGVFLSVGMGQTLPYVSAQGRESGLRADRRSRARLGSASRVGGLRPMGQW